MTTKVVVTGGSGFLGSHLADALTEAGYAVTIFDSKPSDWLQPGQEMLIGDILDEAAVRRCVAGARYVYHLAGIADIGQAALSPKATMEFNIVGSTVVMEACVQARVERLLFASTVYVYSEQGSFYRVSKQAIELLIEAWQERFGLAYTILRYGSLYGPRAQEWNGVKRYVSQAVKEGRIVYRGTGEERRDFIHVKDATRMSVAALAPEYANQCLTLTGAQSLSSRELLRMIQEIMGGEVAVEYQPNARDRFHYELTPYRYTPRGGVKMVPTVFIDLGQGILDLVEETHQDLMDERVQIAKA
jgi:UDP-glucose 4-epimerase